jgi:hypothetical protein
MWNGDEEEPLFAYRVAENDDYRHSALMRDWCLLAQWDRQAYDLALTSYQEAGQPAASAPVMLLCAKRAGVLSGQ